MMRHATKLHAERGFTLVETLVAIAILMIAITGPYYAAHQAILASYAARDQLIASSLAQEGAEYIYFLRDNNYLSGQPWLNGMSSCTSSSGCKVDPVAGSVSACPASSGCPVLNLNSSTGLYNYGNTAAATRFTRTIMLSSVPASPNQERVTVTVTWVTEHRSYTVTVVENIYNWL